MRFEVIGGLDREDSSAIFIKVFLGCGVINPNSWKILTRSGCLEVESREQNRFRYNFLSDKDVKQHMEVGRKWRIVKWEVKLRINAAVSVPLLVRHSTCHFLPSTMELVVLAIIKGHPIGILPLDQAYEY